MLKKILCGIMIAATLLSLCSAAFAADAPQYTVSDAVYYYGEAVEGKVEHVADTAELAKVYARVTLFYADGTFAVMVVPVIDGEFYAGVLTATVHVAVQVVDNKKQVEPPANDGIYGYGVAKIEKK